MLNPLGIFKTGKREENKGEQSVTINYTIEDMMEAQMNFPNVIPGLYKGVVKGVTMDKTRNGYDVINFLVKYEDYNQRKVTWLNAKHIMNSQNLMNAVPPIIHLLQYYGLNYQYDGNSIRLKDACEILVNKDVMISVNTSTNQYGRQFTSILINPYMNM